MKRLTPIEQEPLSTSHCHPSCPIGSQAFSFEAELQDADTMHQFLIISLCMLSTIALPMVRRQDSDGDGDSNPDPDSSSDDGSGWVYVAVGISKSFDFFPPPRRYLTLFFHDRHIFNCGAGDHHRKL
jgi:hypothetical protein